MSFRIDWDSGPSAQIEIVAPSSLNTLMLKYVAPYRATIRAPMQDLELSDESFASIDNDCVKLETLLGVGGRWGGTATQAQTEKDKLESAQQVLQLCTRIGGDLHLLCFDNKDLQADLRAEPLHIELGLEERHLDKPWELLYSDGSFLSLKHHLARFVNSVKPLRPMTMQPRVSGAGEFPMLRVLLISVPQPQPRGQRTFPTALDHAVAETAAITELLQPFQGKDVELVKLEGAQATREKVYKILGEEHFHIIHFNGHAHFDAKRPDSSALMLDNEDVETGLLRRYITKSAPVLCFINACESAATGAGLFGLARAFLDTGAYLIGSRWRISDMAASLFARQFYDGLLLKDEPIGEAVTRARQVCQEKSSPGDLGWASFVYYGDPRVAFRRVKNTAAAPVDPLIP